MQPSMADPPRKQDGSLKVIVAAGRRHDEPLNSVDVEGHALRKRQRLGIVHRVGGAPHIGLPGIGTALAAAAGFLLATESAADLGPGSAYVDIGDTAIRSVDAEKA